MDAELIRIITPWHAPEEDVLAAWQPFASNAQACGWRLNVEWLDPWLDEETGREYPGRHHWFISHEELCSDGRLHAYMLDVPEVVPAWEAAWEQTLALAGIGWRDYLERVDVLVA